MSIDATRRNGNHDPHAALRAEVEALDGQLNRPITRLSKRPVQVTLMGGVIQGTIATFHRRLSDHLLEAGDTIELNDATLLPTAAPEPAARRAQAVINRRKILFVVDLSEEASPLRSAYIPREVVDATVNVGRYWVRGHLHLQLGEDPRHAVVSQSMNRFVVMTNAAIVGSDIPMETLLINRDRIEAVVVHGAAEG